MVNEAARADFFFTRIPLADFDSLPGKGAVREGGGREKREFSREFAGFLALSAGCQ
jgi:hypothetical protein